jgi:hypothetical protein
MAKKKSTKRSKKVWTKELVLADWLGPLEKALGKNKTLSPAIFTNFEAPLLAKIDSRLQNPKHDYNKDRKNVRVVARTIGKFCKVLTGPAKVVPLGVFELVFKACQLYHLCPSPGPGGGKWCDI